MHTYYISEGFSSLNARGPRNVDQGCDMKKLKAYDRLVPNLLFRSSKTPGLRASRFCALNLRTPFSTSQGDALLFVQSSSYGSHTAFIINPHAQSTITILTWWNSCLSRVPTSGRIRRHERGSAPRQCVLTGSDNANPKQPSQILQTRANRRKALYCIGRLVLQRPGRAWALATG